jgi:hypothetical protein
MKGSINEEALAEYSRLAAEKLGVDFAEGEVYDFGRCMRADGSFYGTSGKCRKGSEAGGKGKEAASQGSKPSGPDELDRRIAAKAREANNLAYEGMKDAERRKKETEERRAKRNEPKKSLLQKLKERIKSKSKEG